MHKKACIYFIRNMAICDISAVTNRHFYLPNKLIDILLIFQTQLSIDKNWLYV